MEIAPKTVHTLIPVDSLDQDSMHSLMQSFNEGCINDERQNQLKGPLQVHPVHSRVVGDQRHRFVNCEAVALFIDSLI